MVAQHRADLVLTPSGDRAQSEKLSSEVLVVFISSHFPPGPLQLVSGSAQW